MQKNSLSMYLFSHCKPISGLFWPETQLVYAKQLISLINSCFIPFNDISYTEVLALGRSSGNGHNLPDSPFTSPLGMNKQKVFSLPEKLNNLSLQSSQVGQTSSQSRPHVFSPTVIPKLKSDFYRRMHRRHCSVGMLQPFLRPVHFKGESGLNPISYSIIHATQPEEGTYVR